MKTLAKYCVLIVILLVAAMALSLVAVPVLAAFSGLSVSGALISADVTPGETVTRTIKLSIGASDQAMDISVQVYGMGQSPDGTYVLLDATHDTSAYSARSFTTVDKSSFHLNPGGSESVTVTIQVPQNATNGGRFAIIYFMSQPVASGQGVGIVSAINALVLLTVKGSQLNQTGTISGVTTGTITNGQPVAITTNFKNTGNTYFKVEGSVTITNDQGITLDTIPAPLTESSIIPGMSRNLEAIFTPSVGLPPGTYTINSKIMLSDSTVLDQSTSSFTVKAPYVPPPALGNVSLAPTGASTLRNADGTISIFFPAGAAAIPVDLALNGIAANQLPAAPTGFTFIGSSFQVNGLTGLLAKNATVIVKYTSDDLNKANGKAASLVLMRWDPGTNQWVVLKTKVNTKEMTLTATSKQMGIWAIATGTIKSSAINWMIVSIIAVVIIVSAVATIFLIQRKKRQKRPGKKIVRLELRRRLSH